MKGLQTNTQATPDIIPQRLLKCFLLLLKSIKWRLMLHLAGNMTNLSRCSDCQPNLEIWTKTKEERKGHKEENMKETENRYEEKRFPPQLNSTNNMKQK